MPLYKSDNFVYTVRFKLVSFFFEIFPFLFLKVYWFCILHCSYNFHFFNLGSATIVINHALFHLLILSILHQTMVHAVSAHNNQAVCG